MSGVAVFFTRGVALSTWRDIGSLSRECQVYERLATECQCRLVFVTYGGQEDLRIGRGLEGIEVISNRWQLPRRWYLRRLCIPVPPLVSVDVIKSNQFNGAEEALRVARRLGKRFVCRCGYFPSTKVGWLHGTDSPRAQAARAREEAVFAAADVVSVTTEAMRQRVLDCLPDRDPSSVFVVPNFVDVGLFSPPPRGAAANPARLIYVGRFETEKNVLALVDAVADLDVELWLVGSGSLEHEISSRPARKARVKLLGNVANEDLPALLRQATAFVLPSHFEHHPKALLEAMACGLPCVGSDVLGIRGLIIDGETGLLGGRDVEALRAAIVRLLADADLRRRLGLAARRLMERRYSFHAVYRREEEMLHAAGLPLGGARTTGDAAA